MDLAAFERSLDEATPPADLDPPLAALWWDAKQDWNRAHDLVAQDVSAAAAWVHAYLHRKEGDNANAGYWYRRAQRGTASMSLAEEWRNIALALLARA